MGDSGDEMNIDVDKLPKDSTGETSSLEISDIVKLFTGVIQSQFKTFSGQLKAEQSESISKKLKENSLHKIKSEGNRVQFEFNADLLEGLEKLESRAFDLKDSESLSIISELSKKLKTRQKHIRIADSSPAGWKTVNEYQCNEIADNSDDEKKIRSAENRALRHQKQNKRFQPYGTRKTPPAAAAGSPAQLAFPSVSNSFQPFPAFQQQQQQPFLYGQGRNKQSRRQPMPYDVCFNCFATGHWKSNCPKGKATQSQ
uniref:CCHC-type domain-containing protein n=1 Tax=Magallana gigas TaxID=29159 RepID=A0A8W8J5H9_MAGGI|nr:uncharacterized protein LOC109619834 [Crassostrea gigas]XP_034331123.1 uncharacterized protein LOC109619834 [Crassostrea gigas]